MTTVFPPAGLDLAGFRAMENEHPYTARPKYRVEVAAEGRSWIRLDKEPDEYGFIQVKLLGSGGTGGRTRYIRARDLAGDWLTHVRVWTRRGSS